MPRRKKIVFQISGREKEATASLRRLSTRFQKLMQPIDRLNNKLRANERALRPITTRLNRISNKYKALGEKASLGITAPLTLAGVATAKVATDFETGMIKVKALTSSTAEEFLRMRNLAKSLGTTTQFSAKEAAEGMSFLGMAGFKAKEIIKTIPGVMDLAAASQLELGEASDYASNILTAFGKKAGQMSEVSDKLTYAFTNSNTTLTELHNGLAKVGGVAVKAGVSFEDITASMMALADAGHKGETAGVALAGALSRITKFTMADKANEVTKTLAKLGIKRNEFLDDKTGKFNVRFQDFIKLLDEHGAQLSDYQKIFGQDAGKYIVGLSDNFEKLNGYLEGIKNYSEGLTKAIAKMYMSGTGGAFKLLISALEGLMVKLGDTGFLKVANASLRSIGHMTNSISSLENSTLTYGLAVLGLTALFGPFAFGVGIAVASLKKLVVVLGFTNLAALKLGLITIGWVTLFAVVAYGIYLLVQNWDWMTDKVSNGWKNLIADAKYLWNLFTWAFRDAFVDATNDVIDKLNTFLAFFKDTDFGKWIAKKFGVDLGFKFEHLEKQQKPVYLPPLDAETLAQKEFGQKKEWQWLPEFVSKGFTEVFNSSTESPKLIEERLKRIEYYEEFYPDNVSENQSGYDFRKIIQSMMTERQEAEININIRDSRQDTSVETVNRGRERAKIRVDTGRIMVGA